MLKVHNIIIWLIMFYIYPINSLIIDGSFIVFLVIKLYYIELFDTDTENEITLLLPLFRQY